MNLREFSIARGRIRLVVRHTQLTDMPHIGVVVRGGRKAPVDSTSAFPNVSAFIYLWRRLVYLSFWTRRKEVP